MLQRNMPEEGIMYLILELLGQLYSRYCIEHDVIAPNRVNYPYV